MSMFDWIAFCMPCPRCNEMVSGFQSKDHDRQLQVLLPHLIEYMYSKCEKCDTEIAFNKGRQVAPVYDTGAEKLPVPPDNRDWRVVE